MSTMTSTTPRSSAWVPSPLYRMDLEEYEAMVDSGAFKGGRRFQLIAGLLVAKMTQNPPHTISDDLCGQALARVLPGWYIRPAKPLRLAAQATMNEPDRCVVRGSARDYARQHPGPADVVLVVEVADSSLADDRELGAKAYGPAGIPVYWIINLVDRQIEVHTRPGPGGYESREVSTSGQTVPVLVDGQRIGEIAVDDVLP